MESDKEIIGASAVQADNSAGLFLCSLVFFAGTFTVAVTLGIVCDDISNLVSTVRNGNYQIVEKGHMVILNCNARLRPVLSQVHIHNGPASTSVLPDCSGFKGTRKLSMSNCGSGRS